MAVNLQDSFSNFFKDKQGNVVVWQNPNLPLYGWLIFKTFSIFAEGQLKDGLEHLSTAFLFTWAFLELTKGASYFRRFLGLVVLALITVGYVSDY